MERIIIRTLAGGHVGFPRWLSGKESPCQCKKPGFDPWVRKIPWRKPWQPTPVFLPEKSPGRPWWATVHRVTKSQTWLKDEQATTGGHAMLFSPSVVPGLLQGFFFLRIGVAFRDIPMLTVARSSLIKVSVVFLVHLPPPTSSCSPHSSGTHHTNAHPCICISEQPQAPVLRYVNADKGEW